VTSTPSSNRKESTSRTFPKEGGKKRQINPAGTEEKKKERLDSTVEGKRDQPRTPKGKETSSSLQQKRRRKSKRRREERASKNPPPHSSDTREKKEKFLRRSSKKGTKDKQDESPKGEEKKRKSTFFLKKGEKRKRSSLHPKEEDPFPRKNHCLFPFREPKGRSMM